MTTTEVAELLRTTPCAVRHLAERGRLPGARKFGRRILVRRSDLLQSLNEATMPSQKAEAE
jgi:excisionase family DNA binding protein